MEETAPIDAPDEAVKDSFHLVVRWWESKRIWYNAIGILAILSAFVVASSNNEVDFHGHLIYIVITGTIVCNVAYTFGWVGELFLRHWLKLNPFHTYLHWFLFITGSLFTAFVTFVVWFVLLN